MKLKTFFVKIWWKKDIVMVYLSQIMPSCVNLNLSSPKMWAKFTHIHFSSPKIWAKNEPRSWVNWKKDHSCSHLPSSENKYISTTHPEYLNLFLTLRGCNKDKVSTATISIEKIWIKSLCLKTSDTFCCTMLFQLLYCIGFIND